MIQMAVQRSGGVLAQLAPALPARSSEDFDDPASRQSTPRAPSAHPRT